MTDAVVEDGRAARRARLRALMDERRLGAIVLRRPANFAWYTGGGDSRVDHVAPEGVADVLVGPEDECVVTSAIEAPRMRAEQAVGFEVVEYPWYGDRAAPVRERSGGRRLGADVPIEGAADVSAEVARLRAVLDPDAAQRLREVGRDTTAAMAEAAATVHAGMSEFDAAAALDAACKRRGLSATVLLAAADERIREHRHPVAVGARIQRRAMLVASAERGGLYANLTRIVDLEPPDDDLVRRMVGRVTSPAAGRLRGMPMFGSLLIVVAVAFAAPFILGLFPRLRLPSVVLELIAGIIIGPSVLGIVHEDITIAVIALIGLAFLLFLAGLEIEFPRLRGQVLRLTAAGFVLSFAIALAVGALLQAGGLIQSPLLIAIVLCATSLGVLIPVLKDAGQISSKFGQLVIAAGTIADFGAVILLSIFFSGEGGVGATVLLLGALAVFAIAVVLVVIGAERSMKISVNLRRLQD